jgi:hypothetical protein
VRNFASTSSLDIRLLCCGFRYPGSVLSVNLAYKMKVYASSVLSHYKGLNRQMSTL